MEPSNPPRERLLALIAEIKSLHPKIQPLVDTLKAVCDESKYADIKNQDALFWQTQALTDALIRVRLFIEGNVSHIETLGVLSLCRYTFELVVWLKHFEKDQRFALVYARKLLKQQVEFFRDLGSHLQREITLYDTLAAEEEAVHARILTGAKDALPSADPADIGREIAKSMQDASASIDEKLALQFAIYSSDIKSNGYGFQAHLIKTQALPHANDFAEKNEVLLQRFEEQWNKTIDELKLKLWKWGERAAFVDMGSEYEFIYSYTSRLLHATPASLTTDQKSLEDAEAFMFLRYVLIQFRWIIKYAEERVPPRPLH